VHAIFVERLGDVTELRHQMHPQPEIVILAAEGIVGIAADDFGDRPAIEETGADEIVAAAVEILDRDLGRQAYQVWNLGIAVVGPKARIVEPPSPVVDRLVIGIDKARIGMRGQLRDQPSELVRQHDVVGRRPGQQIAARVIQRMVQGGGETLVRLPQEQHPRLADILPDPVLQIVVRAVVDDDQLPIRIGLGKDASDRLVDQIGLVVDRQNDADERCGRAGHRTGPAPVAGAASGDKIS